MHPVVNFGDAPRRIEKYRQNLLRDCIYSFFILTYTHVPRKTHKARLWHLQARKLLVQQKQEAGHQENRTQQILQLVPQKDQAQRNQEIGIFSFAGDERIGLPTSVLETLVIPLN